LPRVWHDAKRELALWTGVLAGPVVFLALLETNYVLAYVACERRQTWFLHVAVVGAILLVAAAGWAAWRAAPAADDQRRSGAVTPETTESRSRWMSLAAVASCAWFILVILAIEIPILVHQVCD
jgi:hypothetical protein